MFEREWVSKQRHEAKIQRELRSETKNNANIVELIEIVDNIDADVFCLIMEKLGGGELFDVVANCARYRGMTEPDARFILQQIVLSLKHMHGLGVLHRDLKPENVFLRVKPE